MPYGECVRGGREGGGGRPIALFECCVSRVWRDQGVRIKWTCVEVDCVDADVVQPGVWAACGGEDIHPGTSHMCCRQKMMGLGSCAASPHDDR